MCRPVFETEACASTLCSKSVSRETTWNRICKTGLSKVRKVRSNFPHSRAKAAPPQYHEDHFYSQIGKEFVGERYLIPGGDGKQYAGTVIGKGHNCCSVTCQELNCSAGCSTKDTWLIMNDEGDFRCHVSRDELTAMLDLYANRRHGKASSSKAPGAPSPPPLPMRTSKFVAADEAGTSTPPIRHRRASSAPAILCRVTSKLSTYHSEMRIVKLIEEAVRAVRRDGCEDTLKSASHDPATRNVTLAFHYCVGGKPVGELTYVYDTRAHKIIGEEIVHDWQRPPRPKPVQAEAPAQPQHSDNKVATKACRPLESCVISGLFYSEI